MHRFSFPSSLSETPWGKDTQEHDDHCNEEAEKYSLNFLDGRAAALLAAFLVGFSINVVLVEERDLVDTVSDDCAMLSQEGRNASVPLVSYLKLARANL